MRERDQILQLWRETEASGEPAVLATVVKTQGSSYRLPGARFLMTRSGRKAGSVSGGCLETDLRQKCWWLTETGPTLQRYDTTPEGEIGSGFGLGCNGVIHLALERLQPTGSDILTVLQQVKVRREPAVACHVIRGAGEGVKPGQRFCQTAWGARSGNIPEGPVFDACLSLSRLALQTGVSQHRADAASELFAETLIPPVRLLVFGAGDDAIPLTEMAHFLGWDIHVFDGRSHMARRERFPHAATVRTIEPQGSLLTPRLVDNWTVAVVMTHSYSQDLRIVRDLASQPLLYLGVLGPQKRSSQLLEDAGCDRARFDAVGHSPMGLDIGADGPEQVAVSIVAEIQAVLHGRAGGPLKSRAGSIHSEEAETQPFVRPIICA